MSKTYRINAKLTLKADKPDKKKKRMINPAFPGIYFTDEEIEQMQQEQPVYQEEELPSLEDIDQEYLADQLGLEMDEDGKLVPPKDGRAKKRGIFF